jgi:hypothetical protein
MHFSPDRGNPPDQLFAIEQFFNGHKVGDLTDPFLRKKTG